jgi:hypothetical protein
MCVQLPASGAYLLRWDWEMDAARIRQTELPGATALFADYLYAFDRVARFYAWDPHSTESFRRAAAAPARSGISLTRADLRSPEMTA